MGRLFSAALLSAAVMLAPAVRGAVPVQPVFFSMLFPQLIPPSMMDVPEATAGEAVRL